MGSFFQGVFGAAQKFSRKIIPKEIRKIAPKELTIEYMDRKVNQELGLSGQPEPLVPGIPPHEQIDADAYRLRQRNRRRYAGSNVRTSNSGAPYSPAPKQLTGQ
jgi:hypothetical protein